MTSRKKPGVAFWATVGMVVLVGYPLSFGPFLWLDQKIRLPEIIVDSAKVFYDPMLWAVYDGPEWLSRPLDWYVSMWCKPEPIRPRID